MASGFFPLALRRASRSTRATPEEVAGEISGRHPKRLSALLSIAGSVAKEGSLLRAVFWTSRKSPVFGACRQIARQKVNRCPRLILKQGSLAFSEERRMVHTPTKEAIEAARCAFEAAEPRDLFYRAATELVSLALEDRTSLSVAEALAVLLQTWNRMFYRYKRFDERHFAEIERLITDNYSKLVAFRQRAIESFEKADEDEVKHIFKAFERVLGPVGAAKCLHLLAPRFFPIWDRAIAEAYGLPLARAGKNADKYCRFMQIVKQQIQDLGGEGGIGRNPLKAIDEYNYCKYTKKRI